MEVYTCPEDSKFLSYGELLAHLQALSQIELEKPVLCQVEGEEQCFPIVKFKPIEDNRIHLVSGTNTWTTWSELLEFLKKLKAYKLNWYVYIADKKCHYRVNDITQTKYPDGFMSHGTEDFNLLIIDRQDFCE